LDEEHSLASGHFCLLFVAVDNNEVAQKGFCVKPAMKGNKRHACFNAVFKAHLASFQAFAIGFLIAINFNKADNK